MEVRWRSASEAHPIGKSSVLGWYVSGFLSSVAPHSRVYGVRCVHVILELYIYLAGTLAVERGYDGAASTASRLTSDTF